MDTKNSTQLKVAATLNSIYEVRQSTVYRIAICTGCGISIDFFLIFAFDLLSLATSHSASLR